MARPRKNPAPPADIEGDAQAVAEWDRICAAKTKLGHPLKDADRSILLLHCRTWSLHQTCIESLAGGVAELPNGIRCQSAEYKIFVETLKLMRGTLADLGCTPASRDFDSKAAAASPASSTLTF